MEMIVFVGAQGVGKSTFFQQRFRDTHVRINLDMLRTRHREAGLVDACLAFKQPFVVDNTNATREARARYLSPAIAAKFSALAYWFEAPVELLQSRNGQRSGKAVVPDKAILATLRRLEPPSTAEGFTAVYKVRPIDDGKFLIEDGSDEIR